MTDLNETIKSLENYEPYARNFTSIRVKSDVILDALELLKERDNCENCAIAIEDRQPVVRCKDCKHRDPEDRRCDSGHDIRWNLPRQDDWFCADGIRRKET